MPTFAAHHTFAALSRAQRVIAAYNAPEPPTVAGMRRVLISHRYAVDEASALDVGKLLHARRVGSWLQVLGSSPAWACRDEPLT